VTPRERRAELLGPATVAYLKQLADEAPLLSPAQADIIAAAMRGALKSKSPPDRQPRCAEEVS
jgi:hypothetical protein